MTGPEPGAIVFPGVCMFKLHGPLVTTDAQYTHVSALILTLLHTKLLIDYFLLIIGWIGLDIRYDFVSVTARGLFLYLILFSPT